MYYQILMEVGEEKCFSKDYTSKELAEAEIKKLRELAMLNRFEIEYSLVDIPGEPDGQMEDVIKNEVISFLKEVNRDFETVITVMIIKLGGDPGHDVGDSSDSLELTGNIISEHPEEIEEYISALAAASNNPKSRVRTVIQYLSPISGQDWIDLRNLVNEVK